MVNALGWYACGHCHLNKWPEMIPGEIGKDLKFGLKE
jgi:hypothetical protein